MGTPVLKEIIRKELSEQTELPSRRKSEIAEDIIGAVEHFYGKQPHLTGEPIPEMKRGHYEWLEEQLKYKNSDLVMSEFGKLVADILGNLYDGLHHMRDTSLFHERTDWSGKLNIEVVIQQSLSTYDFKNLTELLILCHDNAVRLEINGASRGYVRLYFHPRKREGKVSQRHPTLEEQIQQVRGRNQ